MQLQGPINQATAHAKQPNAPTEVKVRNLYPPLAVDQQIGAFQVAVDYRRVMAAWYVGKRSVLRGGPCGAFVATQNCMIPNCPQF